MVSFIALGLQLQLMYLGRSVSPMDPYALFVCFRDRKDE